MGAEFQEGFGEVRVVLDTNKAAGQAAVLITGDKALLRLAGQAPFAIESAAAFRKRFAI